MVPHMPPERAKLLKEKRDIEEFGLEARKEVQEQTLVGQKVLMLLALIVAWKVQLKKQKFNEIMLLDLSFIVFHINKMNFFSINFSPLKN